MNIKNSLHVVSLFYILICFTFREYYIPGLDLNLEVISSIVYCVFLLILVLNRGKILVPPVGITLLSSYWLILIYLTLAALFTTTSFNILKYILFILPIISISLLYINNENFINSVLTLVKISVIIHLLVSLTAFVDMSIGTKIYTTLREMLSLYSNQSSEFITYPSLRSQGIFYNSSSLASLGLFAIAFNIIFFKKPSLWLLICATVLVVLSGSRVPLICLLIFLALYKGINLKKIIIIFIISIMFFYYIDIDLLIDMFSRIIRIYDNGLYNDYSLSYRINILWPEALYKTNNYTLGTLTNPVEIVGVIDSGYLTAYIQGRWLLVTGLIFSILTLSFISLYDLYKNKGLFFFLIPLYIILGMMISNPISNPLIVMISFFYVSKFFNKEPQAI
ncbi:hypothetical protein QU516_11320 [Moellerella wisconsensis]|uniref:hypothetical protein n=1 Tax=Moellerella wisconsensis TaxID=158849 RepID=UPI0025AFC431|nr:hypothetical protein [Moellerella wisconsensis]WJW81226.1 hypothetical protein QU516_11320 [Moellerella wisconsensis]